MPPPYGLLNSSNCESVDDPDPADDPRRWRDARPDAEPAPARGRTGSGSWLVMLDSDGAAGGSAGASAGSGVRAMNSCGGGSRIRMSAPSVGMRLSGGTAMGAWCGVGAKLSTLAGRPRPAPSDTLGARILGACVLGARECEMLGARA